MIYISTVHWKTDKWIDLQLHFLKQCIQEEYKIYGFLNDVPKEHYVKFHYFNTEDIQNHSIKLNMLADRITADAKSDNDILIFIDGDAFPIDNLSDFAASHLSNYPLIAVKRTEENGEKQPHPCFCITTVGFWKNIKGDWQEGYQWQDERGNLMSDVGGNLLGKLQSSNIDWLPLERSNKEDLHPLLFGIYGDIVYHHGAGFRNPDFRINANYSNLPRARFQRFISKIVPKKVRHLVPQKIRFRLQASNREIVSNQKLSDQIFHKIRRAPNFIDEYLRKGNPEVDMIDSQCIIVLGMHRSGTSCLMGTLRRNGVFTGEVNESNIYNRLGTIEHPDIYKLNEAILEFNGGSWDNPPERIVWNEKHIRSRDRIIKKLTTTTQTYFWGFKDPRTLFTLPFWLEGIDKFRIVGTFRNPMDVAESLFVREKIKIDIEEGLKLWLKYNLQLIEILRKYNGHLISFDQKRDTYNVNVREILIQIGILTEKSPDILKFYDESLINNQNTSREIPKSCSSLYNELLNYNP